MADHRRPQGDGREGRDRVKREGGDCHLSFWAVLPELLEEERKRRLDQKLEQVAELEDER